MNAPRGILFALFGAALVAGCSSSSTGPTTLTSTQAQAMAGALMQMTQSASSAAYDSAATASAAPAPAASPALVTVDSLQTQVKFTAPCALGGTVGVDASVTGTFNLQDTTLDMTFGMVQTPNSCVVQDQKSGMQFTLSGNPNVTADFTLHAAPQSPFTLSGTVSGAVDWTSDSGSGTCSVSLTYDATADPQTQASTATVQGTVCGVSVQTTVSST